MTVQRSELERELSHIRAAQGRAAAAAASGRSDAESRAAVIGRSERPHTADPAALAATLSEPQARVLYARLRARFEGTNQP